MPVRPRCQAGCCRTHPTSFKRRCSVGRVTPSCVATASMQFFRSIGGSVGVAIMGTIMGMRLQPILEQYQLSGAEGGANALLKPASRGALSPDVLAALQLGLTEGIHHAFYVMAFAAVAGLIAVLWFPRALGEPVGSRGISSVVAWPDEDVTAAG